MFSESFRSGAGRRRRRGKTVEGSRVGPAEVRARPWPLNSTYPPGKKGVNGRCRTWGIGRWQWPRFDASGPHVGQELVWDFSKHFFSQTGHAENVVSSSVNVVSEGNELENVGKERGDKD